MDTSLSKVCRCFRDAVYGIRKICFIHQILLSQLSCCTAFKVFIHNGADHVAGLITVLMVNRPVMKRLQAQGLAQTI